MMEKRYAIVRVDNNCPEYMEEDFVCPYPDKKEECLKCKQYRYGDTKEQWIRKVAQVLFKEELSWYAEYVEIIPKGKIDEPFCRNIYEHCLEKARKIVEFLGVCDDTN